MATDPPQPVYVLQGDDAFLRDHHRHRITREVVGETDPQLAVTSFEADADLADVLDELRTVPFLAPRRLVIVRDADEFVSAHREALETFLQHPPSAASLMLLVSSWPKNTRLAKLVAKIGQAVDCSFPTGGNLPRWLDRAAKARGKRLARPAADLLVQWVGQDLAVLDSEIEKLSLYVEERDEITAGDVSVVVTASTGPAAFALTNAITRGRADEALAALGGMLRTRGDEFRTLGMIGWHLRRAVQAKEQLAAGMGPQQALPRMPPAQRQAFLAMLQRRGLAAFRQDFRRLLRADLAMKSGADAVVALQELVVQLCS